MKSAGIKNLKTLIVTLIPSLSYAENYATCLLDKLPNLQNDVAAQSVIQVCMKKHPGGYLGVEKGSGQGLFAPYNSGAECTIDKAKDTRSNSAGMMIGFACRYLYDEPAPSISPWEEYKSVPQPSLPPSNQSSPPTQASLQEMEIPNTSAINHYEKIYLAHPDADGIASSKSFQQWVTQTSSEKILQNGSTENIIRLFEQYKAQLADSKIHSSHINTQEENPCIYKAVMTDEDYYRCGIKPPK